MGSFGDKLVSGTRAVLQKPVVALGLLGVAIVGVLVTQARQENSE